MDFSSLIDKDFRGVISVVQNGTVLCNRVSGFADLSNQIPNTLDTKFATASAGKAFVAAAVLQLIDRGKLSFESRLGQLLDIDLHQIDPDVTVRQLLTHTSGVPDYFDESIMEDYEELWRDYPNYKIRRNFDLFPLFMEKPMAYPKGERFCYNNSGYVLLAAIIEKISGTAFDQYLKEQLFDPSGMSSTGYYELDRLPANTANHYIYCEETGGFRTNIYSVDVKGSGAGGAFTTVMDAIRFWERLIHCKFFSKELTAEMLRRQSGDGADPEEGYYGYGVWIIEDERQGSIPYFQGCDPGVSFLSEYNPNNHIISVLVSNYGDNVWREMRKIRRELYR